MSANRCLESAASLGFANVEECVDKTRFRMPRWLAWVTVSLFCSIHLIVPTVMVGMVVALLLCFRGKYILETIDWALASSFVPDIASRTASEVTATVDWRWHALTRRWSVMWCPRRLCTMPARFVAWLCLTSQGNGVSRRRLRSLSCLSSRSSGNYWHAVYRCLSPSHGIPLQALAVVLASLPRLV